MSPTIRVDDEVYAMLQAEAEPFTDTPNSVLRRKLGLKREGSGGTQNAPSPRDSKVGNLLAAGLLHPKDALSWRRPQKGQHFRAFVTDDGRLRLEDGSIHDSPSAAARSLAGYEVNGLRTWRRESDGRTLDELWRHRDTAGSGGA